MCTEREELGNAFLLPDLSCGDKELQRTELVVAGSTNAKGSRLTSGLQKGRNREEGGPILLPGWGWGVDVAL